MAQHLQVTVIDILVAAGYLPEDASRLKYAGMDFRDVIRRQLPGDEGKELIAVCDAILQAHSRRRVAESRAPYSPEPSLPSNIIEITQRFQRLPREVRRRLIHGMRAAAGLPGHPEEAEQAEVRMAPMPGYESDAIDPDVLAELDELTRRIWNEPGSDGESGNQQEA